MAEEKWKVFLKVRGKGNKLNTIKTAYRIPVSVRGTISKRKQSNSVSLPKHGWVPQD